MVLVAPISVLVDHVVANTRFIEPVRGRHTEEELVILPLPDEICGEEKGLPGVGWVLVSPSDIMGANGDVDPWLTARRVEKAGRARRRGSGEQAGDSVGGAVEGGLERDRRWYPGRHRVIVPLRHRVPGAAF